MRSNRCENCIYWERDEQIRKDLPIPKHGDCLHRSPVVVIEGSEAGETAHPTKHENSWCGEFDVEKANEEANEELADKIRTLRGKLAAETALHAKDRKALLSANKECALIHDKFSELVCKIDELQADKKKLQAALSFRQC